ncbi:CdaR family protein [Urechidicola croceus]|uniref:YbbR-like domain-containing protein n=1 Tax=Urechidicola croceus TaxID=1850246 RepID=A0A1D8P4H7_9FLAO|nr:CdaR family protein [Urechidicola croceus]AOW19411.1 hypothetical protein LPB138_01350 [Urechidicola croceus]
MAKRTSKQLKTDLKLRMFLVFLSLSFVFWMLIKLSKTYTDDVVFNVDYSNYPEGKVIQNNPVNSVRATIQSTGFSLLNYKFKTKKIVFDVNKLAHKSGSTYYYLPNNHLNEYKVQLNEETKIERISNDTIFINLGENKTKKIPVELDASIQFKLGYNLVGEIKIVPDSISITGPEEQLDTIHKIITNKLELLEVSDEINKNVKLKLPDYKKISFSDKAVLLNAQVDKFTEGSVKVPFKIVNLPRNYNITTFPKEVKVIYQVGLSNFNKITEENINVVCDYAQSESNNLNYLIPQLIEKSTLITSVRIEPNKIEFLIEK